MESQNETKTCPYCSESILINAQKCKHCGEFLNEKLRQERAQTPSPSVSVMRVAKWNPGVAAALSFVIPGLGQIYKGQLLNGICAFGAVIIGYICFIIPGIILHLICIFEAAMAGDPYA